MKRIKSVLALLVALCLMMCLAVPAFATDVAAPKAADGVVPSDQDIVITIPDEDPADTTGAAEEEHDHETEAEESKGGFVKVLRIILTVLEVIASLALIIVVLVQSGKESGLSGALSGNSDSYMNRSGMGGLDKTLAKATKWVALVWILLTLALCLL